MLTVSGTCTFSTAPLKPWRAEYFERVHWSERRRTYMVPVLKPWKRWRERRGVGRSIWKPHGPTRY